MDVFKFTQVEAPFAVSAEIIREIVNNDLILNMTIQNSLPQNLKT